MTQQRSQTDSEPDGGVAGWVAVFARWLRGFLRIGLMKGLGIMLPTLQDQFATKAWVIGWIASMISATTGFSGIFAGLTGRLFGSGVVVMVCGVMTAASAIAASFASNPFQFAVMLAVLAGVGFGVSGVILKESCARGFSQTYGVANGISRTGTAVSLFVFPPLIQLFLSTYGWRGTMLLIGAICFNFTACGALMKTTSKGQVSRPQQHEEEPIFAAARSCRKGYQALSEHESSAASTVPTKFRSSCLNCFKYAFKNLDFGLLLNGRYWALAIFHCCMALVFDLWIIYFVSLILSKGFSQEDAATFVSVGGACSLVARVVQGFIIDRGVLPSWGFACITASVISVSLCATPWLTSYWTLMASAVLILVCNGVLVCLNDVLKKDVMGVEHLAGTFGWIGIKAAIVTMSLGFLPGWIYDTTGSYNMAFVMLGIIQGASLIPIIMLKHLKYIA